jgi:hypothetical protein
MNRPTETETEKHWMLRLFKDGKWKCDVGEYFDRDECLEAISKKKTGPDEEWVPIKQTSTTVTEYHP